jgi:DNA-directed RNA polymerase specialized sigma24 family protein
MPFGRNPGLRLRGSTVSPSATRNRQPAYSLAAIRQTRARAYGPWSEEEEAAVRFLAERGWTATQLAGALGRRRGGIRSRLRRLGLIQ